MIEVYKITDRNQYLFIAGVDEETGRITGYSDFANWLRGCFNEMEHRNIDPVNYMDYIKSKLQEMYNDGYVMIV